MDGTGFYGRCPLCGGPQPVCDPCPNCFPPFEIRLWLWVMAKIRSWL
jgi:hypothetical protein